MKLGITSDIHLNHFSTYAPIIRTLFKKLTKGLDGLIICGDIAIGRDLNFYLENLTKGSKCPVYFVLGNHDRWHVPYAFADSVGNDYLEYLPNKIHHLTNDTCLVGVNGWFDARAGEIRHLYETNDLNFIPELFNVKYQEPELLKKIREFADKEASDFNEFISKQKLDDIKRMIIATHYPPWVDEWDDSCYYPWSVSVIMGQTLEAIANKYPTIKFDIFAGHTHKKRFFQIKDNITLTIGNAKYGDPVVQKVIEVN